MAGKKGLVRKAHTKEKERKRHINHADCPKENVVAREKKSKGIDKLYAKYAALSKDFEQENKLII